MIASAARLEMPQVGPACAVVPPSVWTAAVARSEPPPWGEVRRSGCRHRMDAFAGSQVPRPNSRT